MIFRKTSSPHLLFYCMFVHSRFLDLLQVSQPWCFPADISYQKCEINLTRAVWTQHRSAARICGDRALPPATHAVFPTSVRQGLKYLYYNPGANFTL